MILLILPALPPGFEPVLPAADARRIPRPQPRSRSGRPIAGSLAVAVILGSAAFAQTHEPECMPSIDSTPAAADQTKAQRPLADWAGLERYRDEDAAVPPASSKLPRVIFLGDSITEAWELADAAVIAGEVLNRGIGGQTTPQMLVRFRQDVIDLKPAVVHAEHAPHRCHAR